MSSDACDLDRRYLLEEDEFEDEVIDDGGFGIGDERGGGTGGRSRGRRTSAGSGAGGRGVWAWPESVKMKEGCIIR